jgi:hypothetical protein
MVCSSQNGLTNGKWHQQHQGQQVYAFVCDTCKTSSMGSPCMVSISTHREGNHACSMSITTQEARDYRNEVFYLRWMLGPLWRVCDREGRSRRPPSHSPASNKMPSRPCGARSLGSRSLVIAAAGHLPEHLVGLVKRDLSWGSQATQEASVCKQRHTTWPFIPGLSSLPENHTTS